MVMAALVACLLMVSAALWGVHATYSSRLEPSKLHSHGSKRVQLVVALFETGIVKYKILIAMVQV